MERFEVLKKKQSKAVLHDTVLLLSRANGNNDVRLKIVFGVMSYFFGEKIIKADVAFSLKFTQCLYFLDNLIAENPSLKKDLSKIKKETGAKKGFTISDTERRLAFAGMTCLYHEEQKKLLNILRCQIQQKIR